MIEGKYPHATEQRPDENHRDCTPQLVGGVALIAHNI